jgi:hypothetical protein
MAKGPRLHGAMLMLLLLLMMMRAQEVGEHKHNKK